MWSSNRLAGDRTRKPEGRGTHGRHGPTAPVLLALALLLGARTSATAQEAGSAERPATDVHLPALFSDRMVMQRDRPIRVWGRADPGVDVRITLDVHAATAKAGADGRWRAELPFLFVQLAGFQTKQRDPVEASPGGELREAQAMALRLPHTGMAVAADLGDADDIHPRNKQEVGRRLALAALHDVYGRDLVYAGPTYRAMERHGDTIRIFFDHVGGGLEARGGPLGGFAIAGADSPFVWADVRIDGATVVVSSPDVRDPGAVRYGWADHPAGNLYNREGLPAAPFRTDVGPGEAAGPHQADDHHEPR